MRLYTKVSSNVLICSKKRNIGYEDLFYKGLHVLKIIWKKCFGPYVKATIFLLFIKRGGTGIFSLSPKLLNLKKDFSTLNKLIQQLNIHKFIHTLGENVLIMSCLHKVCFPNHFQNLTLSFANWCHWYLLVH